MRREESVNRRSRKRIFLKAETFCERYIVTGAESQFGNGFGGEWWWKHVSFYFSFMC